MVAEVKGPSGNAVTPLSGPAAKADKSLNPVTKAGAGLEDVVQLTDLGTRLQELVQAVAAVPEVDQARVEQVRHALVEGSFQVEPEVVADKLIAMENLLGTGQQS